jgi:hypothetical protein
MYGILLDPETYDISAPTGTLKMGDTAPQCAEMVLIATPGAWKELPRMGADLNSQLGGCRDPFWPSRARQMLRAASLDVEEVTLEADGTVSLN